MGRHFRLATTDLQSRAGVGPVVYIGGMLKQSRFPHLRLVSVLLATIAVGCRPADQAEVSIPPETEQAVARLGGEAAGELVTTLGSRLQRAIAERGAVGALEFCSVEGLPLTAEVSRATGFEVKRTSSRLRNPANAPDSLERAALDRFEAVVAAGDSLPEHVVQGTPAGDFRYYRPLRVQPLCLQCHGSLEDLAAGVNTALAERYPEDEATGYAVGDLRGVVRVTVPRSALE